MFNSNLHPAFGPAPPHSSARFFDDVVSAFSHFDRLRHEAAVDAAVERDPLRLHQTVVEIEPLPVVLRVDDHALCFHIKTVFYGSQHIP